MNSTFSNRASLALALAGIAIGACSSSGGNSSNPAATGTTSGSTGTGSTGAGGGSGTCDHVIVPDSEFVFGFDPQALAADGGQVYVLVDDGMGRSVSVAENRKMREV